MKTIQQDNLPAHIARPSEAQQTKRRARRAAKQDAPGSPTPSTATSRIICNATGGRNYTHPELAPYQGRPGSLDHLAMPSRVGN